MDAARLARWWSSGGLAPPLDAQVVVEGEDPVLACRHRPGEAAAAALALVGAEAARLWQARGGEAQAVRVDVAAAATSLLGFALQSASAAPELGRVLNATIGLYETGDGRWIHLHGGFPHLASGLVDLLGLPASAVDDREAVAGAVALWDAAGLESAVADAGLCAAVVRSGAEWSALPQAEVLAQVPVVEIVKIGDSGPEMPGGGSRPLARVRVIDQTRVLAGPTCGRTLAEHGAEVLRIGARRLPSIEAFVIDTGRGKRNAFVDLATSAGESLFWTLLSDADVCVQGYRSGSFEARGLGAERLADARPGIVVAQSNCYGHNGPWATRRGWEQLAQCVSGIADAERDDDGRPRLIPAAATDYVSGYLAAFGVIAALARRAEEGGSWLVRTSLCRTARWISEAGADCRSDLAAGLGDVGARLREVESAWGRLRYLAPVLDMALTPPRSDIAAAPLGSSAPVWTDPIV